GNATTSGYPRTVRRWRRGTLFAEAETIFEGLADDVFVYVNVDHEAGFKRTFVVRHFSFYDSEKFIVDRDGALRRVGGPSGSIFDVRREWLTVRLRSPWKPKVREFATDSLLAIRFDAFMAGDRDFAPLFEPSERRTIRDSAWARDWLAIGVLDNMRTQVLMAEPSATGWAIGPLAGGAGPGALDLHWHRSGEGETPRGFWLTS